MNGIRVYFEGAPALREGFSVFLAEVRSKASARRVRLDPIACRGKGQAIGDFLVALRKHANALNVLLIDSDGPDDGRLFERLTKHNQEVAAHDQKIFWMVQTMESWFLADPDALEGYFDGGFQRNALRANPKVEEIPKKDVEDCLKQATRNCGKGKYHKTNHAPGLLKNLDSRKVCAVAPNCNRLFQFLSAELDRYVAL